MFRPAVLKLRSPSVVATLSFMLPGLGQLALGAAIRGALLLSPAVVIAIIALVGLIQGDDPYDLVFDPGLLTTLLVANGVFAAYHVLAIGDAWRIGVRRSPTGRPSRRSIGVLAVLLAVTLGLHGWIEYVGIDANATLDAVFPSGPDSSTAGGGGGGGASDPDAAGADPGATGDEAMIPDVSFSDLPSDDPGGDDASESDEPFASDVPATSDVPGATTQPGSAIPGGGAGASATPSGSGAGASAPPAGSGAGASLLPSGTPAPSHTPGPSPTRKPANVPAWARDGRLNLLLIGADSGPDRWSLRTDTMIVLSVDARSGRAALFGIPRNLIGVPLPPESAGAFKDGRFPGLLNALYVYAMGHPDTFPGGRNRGFRAVSGAVEELIGVPLDGMVVVNLAAFVRLVNELDGLWIDIPERLYDDNYPLEDGSGHITVDFRAGCQHLDGRMALAYARSRHQDSDYGRMARQQEVLLALRRELDPLKLVPKVPALLRIASDNLWTTIRRADVASLARLAAKVNVRRIRTVLFVPSQYAEHVDDAEVAAIRHVVRGALRGPLPPLADLPSGSNCR